MEVTYPSQQKSCRSVPDEMKHILLSSGPSPASMPPLSSPGKQTRFVQQHEQYIGSDGVVDGDHFQDTVSPLTERLDNAVISTYIIFWLLLKLSLYLTLAPMIPQ